QVDSRAVEKRRHSSSRIGGIHFRPHPNLKRDPLMKRLIATLSFAALATAAFADNGKPFEQLDLDRALPNIPERASTPTAYPFGGSAPYEQLAVDRALPNIPEKAGA